MARTPEEQAAYEAQKARIEADAAAADKAANDAAAAKIKADQAAAAKAAAAAKRRGK